MASRIDVRRIALVSVLSAMALAVQYLESLLPAPVPGVPVKLGLANVFTLYALLTLGPLDALFVSLLRCLLYPLFSGAVSGFFYALSGSLLSYLCMLLLLPLWKRERISPIGVSVAGAFCFNVGQLVVGVLALGRAMLAYFPIMGLLSVPAGICTGLLASILKKRVPLRLRRS